MIYMWIRTPNNFLSHSLSLLLTHSAYMTPSLPTYPANSFPLPWHSSFSSSIGYLVLYNRYLEQLWLIPCLFSTLWNLHSYHKHLVWEITLETKKLPIIEIHQCIVGKGQLWTIDLHGFLDPQLEALWLTPKGNCAEAIVNGSLH